MAEQSDISDWVIVTDVGIGFSFVSEWESVSVWLQIMVNHWYNVHVMVYMYIHVALDGFGKYLCTEINFVLVEIRSLFLWKQIIIISRDYVFHILKISLIYYINYWWLVTLIVSHIDLNINIHVLYVYFNTLWSKKDKNYYGAKNYSSKFLGLSMYIDFEK